MDVVGGCPLPALAPTLCDGEEKGPMSISYSNLYEKESRRDNVLRNAVLERCDAVCC